MTVPDIIAVFAVVEQTHPVTVFRQICPFLTANFVSGSIPGSILVSRPFHIAKLNFIDCLICMNIHRKICFKENLIFIPVNSGFKIDSGNIIIYDHVLRNDGIQKSSSDAQAPSHRPIFYYFCIFNVIHFPHLFLIVDVNIPVIILQGSVLKCQNFISSFIFTDYLPIVSLVKNR